MGKKKASGSGSRAWSLSKGGRQGGEGSTTSTTRNLLECGPSVETRGFYYARPCPASGSRARFVPFFPVSSQSSGRRRLGIKKHSPAAEGEQAPEARGRRENERRGLRHQGGASRELAAELADVEERLAEHDPRLPSAAPLDDDAEVRKAMQVIERIEAVCGNADARGELPRLLDDLGVRIGLTFRAGITNRRAARVLQGGIMAFGNRQLPCTLRTSGGRPLAGGHEEHRGRARSPAGGKTARSRRRGNSTGPNGPSRGGGATTPVDSKNPRQPSGTERLSKGTSGGRT